MRLAIAIALLLVAPAYAGRQQFVDPSRSAPGRDVTEVSPTRSGKAPFEYQQIGDLSVGYSLAPAYLYEKIWLRLTLIFRNDGAASVSVSPVVTLTNADHLVVKTADYESLFASAQNIAAAPIPPAPPTFGAHTSTTTGEVRNTATGDRSTVQLTTQQKPLSPAEAVQAALAHSEASIASRDAGALISWLPQYWLKGPYEIPGGSAVATALLYPTNGRDALPVTVLVTVGDKTLTFRSDYSKP